MTSNLSYYFISGIYLLLILLGQEHIAWYIKPLLLLPLLYIAFSVKPTEKWLILALLSSWIGDIVLMFQDDNANYFIIGLLCFLIAHMSYILLFIKEIKSSSLNPKVDTKFYFAIGGFWMFMVYLLFPHLGEMLIPVMIYSLVISIMMGFAYYVQYVRKSALPQWIFWGAIFFVLSDSILAFNKFYTPLPIASLGIMSTYVVAQYLIVKGWINQNS